jgi:hypothetical protein
VTFCGADDVSAAGGPSRRYLSDVLLGVSAFAAGLLSDLVSVLAEDVEAELEEDPLLEGDLPPRP